LKFICKSRNTRTAYSTLTKASFYILLTISDLFII
jgi:hypothetical protein